MRGETAANAVCAVEKKTVVDVFVESHRHGRRLGLHFHRLALHGNGIGCYILGILGPPHNAGPSHAAAPRNPAPPHATPAPVFLGISPVPVVPRPVLHPPLGTIRSCAKDITIWSMARVCVMRAPTFIPPKKRWRR